MDQPQHPHSALRAGEHSPTAVCAVVVAVAVAVAVAVVVLRSSSFARRPSSFVLGSSSERVQVVVLSSGA